VGKLKTIVQMVALSMLLFREDLFGLKIFAIGEGLLAIAAALTLWSGLDVSACSVAGHARKLMRCASDRIGIGS
jgi:phosphatidylglycerophosphate synthase